MITDMYIGPNELNQIKLIIDVLHEAHEKLHELTDVSVDLFTDASGWGTAMAVRDCNGDVIGHVGIGDSGGVVMYFDNGEN